MNSSGGPDTAPPNVGFRRPPTGSLRRLILPRVLEPRSIPVGIRTGERGQTRRSLVRGRRIHGQPSRGSRSRRWAVPMGSTPEVRDTDSTRPSAAECGSCYRTDGRYHTPRSSVRSPCLDRGANPATCSRTDWLGSVHRFDPWNLQSRWRAYSDAWPRTGTRVSADKRSTARSGCSKWWIPGLVTQ